MYDLIVTISNQKKLITYCTEIASCTKICWRCQVSSITELSSITVLALLLTVQAETITVGTCWA